MNKVSICAFGFVFALLCCADGFGQYAPASHGNAVSHGNEAGHSYPLNYDIYRDRSTLPLDPRKPCNPCTQVAGHPDIPGLRGRPHQDEEPGGCRCGDRTCDRCDKPDFSVYWPRPFSARLNDKFPNLSGDSRRPRIYDCFDCLRDFRLIDYQRTDDGYCGDCLGRNRDPYGCLGESRQLLSNVAGVGFRSPGEPLRQGFPAPQSYSGELYPFETYSPAETFPGEMYDGRMYEEQIIGGDVYRGAPGYGVPQSYPAGDSFYPLDGG